ncbi:unnamed protein product [Euphydryas editha]|uniref:Uncharacterized protein n=1 Tax=Euphydryas editha TaxID=104508 RepID=A0AAU9UUP3_EUPED|nr:unnamed protein product [Euphydryas editha]
MRVVWTATLLNTCIRFIFGLRKYDHIAHYRSLVKWLPICERRNSRILCLLFILLFHLTPYLKCKFSLSTPYLKCKFSYFLGNAPRVPPVRGKSYCHGNRTEQNLADRVRYIQSRANEMDFTRGDFRDPEHSSGTEATTLPSSPKCCDAGCH